MLAITRGTIMGNAEGLLDSLAGMGFIELGLAFAALCCYALALNASLGSQTRTVATGVAALAAAGFAFATDPWVNGVILVAIGIAAMGIFVAGAWAISAICGMTAHAPALVAEPPAEAGELPTATTPVPLRPAATGRPIHSA